MRECKEAEDFTKKRDVEQGLEPSIYAMSIYCFDLFNTFLAIISGCVCLSQKGDKNENHVIPKWRNL